MGAIIGLLFGSGLVLLYWWWQVPHRPRSARLARGHQRVTDLLTQAGLGDMRPATALAVCLGSGLVALVVLWVATGALPVGVCFGLLVGLAPALLVTSRARARRETLRALWPDVIDDLLSAVRAGTALPDTLVSLAHKGPPELREAFAAYAAHYRAAGRFDDALNTLKAELADPVADRIVEALRLARGVGGTELGVLLRSLSTMLRADLHARGELQARQSWTINGARLAAAAPWIVLLILATRGEAMAVYRTSAGAMVLLVGAVATVVAYWLMLRVGRLPEERRMLQ
ncbi:type II secretion system F family protein [Buchananella hordeovulneris]|uniref:type II secretion system F family protein n=1 Tax=Buchananella hordeovulneris TaxID=52770 RepID=UPI000F5DB30F|nr:type II secretion system F family protein [Buchananella hordeovulneris]RRD42349.1 type II secretion system protein F [Buchananella hordeovulneris]